MILIWISCRWAWVLSYFLIFQEPQKEDPITLRRCGIWICNATLRGQGSTLTHSIYHVGHKVWPEQKELQFSDYIESILVADEKSLFFMHWLQKLGIEKRIFRLSSPVRRVSVCRHGHFWRLCAERLNWLYLWPLWFKEGGKKEKRVTNWLLQRICFRKWVLDFICAKTAWFKIRL